MNVRWTTDDVQSRNRRTTIRITHRGETLCLTDWAVRLGLRVGTLHQRLSSGWSVERALHAPTRKRGIYTGKPTSERQKLWRVWKHIIDRCGNPDDKAYPYYGGRGISIHPAWAESFDAFLAGVGPRPSSQHSLDRFPASAGNYEPGNVRWATAKEQAASRRPRGSCGVTSATLPRLLE
jgi:hypothetical protein